MHPQAILVDSTAAEDAFFLRAARDQVASMRAALIELPARPATRLSWVAKLDSSSLAGRLPSPLAPFPLLPPPPPPWRQTKRVDLRAAWNKVHFDILVRAPAAGTGNLGRLLRSIASADLAGHVVPHLTVELPRAVEAPLQRFLARYQWPPPTVDRGPLPSMLTLRRRVPSGRLGEEESSVRFLESFWPRDPAHTHVLVLSPRVELTPQFLHCELAVSPAVSLPPSARPGEQEGRRLTDGPTRQTSSLRS